MKKVAIIIGHEKNASGAVNFLGESEYIFNSRIASHLASRGCRNAVLKRFYRDGVGMTGAYDEAAKWGAEIAIELHFNSAGPTARGCEVLCPSGDSLSIQFAKSIAMAIHKEFDIKLRRDEGAFEVSIPERGSYNIFAGKNAGIKVCVLIEPCFAEKSDESERFFKNEKIYAARLAETIENFIDNIEATMPAFKKATLEGLVRSYKETGIEFSHLKAITLAQWLLESARVTSDLAVMHYNFGGIKYRDFKHNIPNVIGFDYQAHDGKEKYFQCPDYTSFIRLYWKFLERSPYIGWRNHIASGEDFINFIGPIYCPNKDYVKKVLSLLPEAKQLLRE